MESTNDSTQRIRLLEAKYIEFLEKRIADLESIVKQPTIKVIIRNIQYTAIDSHYYRTLERIRRVQGLMPKT